MLFKLDEWQGASGKWYCGCTADLANQSNRWYTPARVLGVAPAAMLKELVEKYDAELFHNEDFSFVGYSFISQTKMRQFKNLVNAKAREKSFQI